MAVKYTMRLDAGAHYFLRATWKDPDGVPINLTNYTARMMLRSKYSDPLPLVSLTSEEGGGIEIKAEIGALDIAISDSSTSSLAAAGKETRGVYDLEVEAADGVVYRLCGGEWICTPEATK